MKNSLSTSPNSLDPQRLEVETKRTEMSKLIHGFEETSVMEFP